MVLWVVDQLEGIQQRRTAEEMYKNLTTAGATWIWLDSEDEQGQMLQRCETLINKGYSVMISANRLLDNPTHTVLSLVQILVKEDCSKAEDHILLDEETYPCGLLAYVSLKDKVQVDFTQLAATILGRLGLYTPIGYPYDNGCLLKNPIKYEFSPYRGPGFLDAYEKKRQELVAQLRANGNRLHPLVEKKDAATIVARQIEMKFAGLGVQIADYGRMKAHPAGEILAAKCLFDMFVFSLDCPMGEREAATIEIFIKKFEVAKRIRRIYDAATFRPVDSSYEELMPYLLLAQLLLWYIDKKTQQERKLIAFNTLVKLNDTISSEISSLCTPAEYELAACSIEGELEKYKQLKTKGCF